MKAFGKIVVLVALAVAMLLSTASSALAVGPQIVDLASPTHPYEYNPYYSRDAAFTWSAAPGPVASFQLSGSGRDVAIVGDYAYVAADGVGLEIVNVGEPTAPTAVASCDLGSPATGVTVEGNHAYVAAGYSLVVVDITVPTAPAVAGSCALQDWASGVAVEGDYAYVADGYGGLQVVDISTPGAPTTVASCSFDGYGRDVAVAGGYAYVAAYWGGLVVVDISTPTAPEIAGTAYDCGESHSVAVAGDLVYVAGGWSGLHVVDASAAPALSLVSTTPMPGAAVGVALDGDVAAVAAEYGGVQVVDVSTPAAPQIAGSTRWDGYAASAAFAGGHVIACDGNGNGFLQICSLAFPTAFAYVYSLDQDYGVEPDTPAEGAEGEATFAGLSDGYWYFKVRAMALDEQGEPTGDWSPTATFVILVEHVPRITELWSPTHPDGWSWYAARVATFEWRATPEAGDCGYSFVVDQFPDTVPDAAVTTDETTATVENLPLGTSWLHVRAVDAEGNWGPAEHFQVQIKQGPVTMALSYKTTKSGVIWLQYSVSDSTVSNECLVSIDIRTPAASSCARWTSAGSRCNVAFTAVWTSNAREGQVTPTRCTRQTGWAITGVQRPARRRSSSDRPASAAGGSHGHPPQRCRPSRAGRPSAVQMGASILAGRLGRRGRCSAAESRLPRGGVVDEEAHLGAVVQRQHQPAPVRGGRVARALLRPDPGEPHARHAHPLPGDGEEHEAPAGEPQHAAPPAARVGRATALVDRAGERHQPLLAGGLHLVAQLVGAALGAAADAVQHHERDGDDRGHHGREHEDHEHHAVHGPSTAEGAPRPWWTTAPR